MAHKRGCIILPLPDKRSDEIYFLAALKPAAALLRQPHSHDIRCMARLRRDAPPARCDARHPVMQSLQISSAPDPFSELVLGPLCPSGPRLNTP